jgi:hypothetical protein
MIDSPLKFGELVAQVTENSMLQEQGHFSAPSQISYPQHAASISYKITVGHKG